MVVKKVQTSATKIADNIYRLSVAPSQHLEFSSFLILDDSPCLVHAGKLSLYEPLKEMVLSCLNGKELKYVVFSHVESDESGAVNNWLEDFATAELVCNKLSNMSLGDSLLRPAQILKNNEILDLGVKKLKIIETPHFPHNWDAHMWIETESKVLFSSDFCCQGGIAKPITEDDISNSIISFYDKGGFIPYEKSTNEALEKINEYDFEMIAPMHGSVISSKNAQSVFTKV